MLFDTVRFEYQVITTITHVATMASIRAPMEQIVLYEL